MIDHDNLPANDDDLEYAVGECQFTFDELINAIRGNGGDVTCYVISEDGIASPIAND